MAIPATADLIGTPASIRASDPPHTEAIEDDPLDSMISDTTRTVYGKPASVGITGNKARSASIPCPSSRRLVPRIGLVSPVEKGGKL